MNLRAKITGSASALLLAGAAIFGTSMAVADPYGTAPEAGGVSHEVVAAGSAVTAHLTSEPGTDVTLQVTTPGGSNPRVQAAGSASLTRTTDAEGVARFRITIPANTPAGTVELVGTNAAGAVIYRASLGFPAA